MVETKVNRNKVRTPYAMKIFADVVAMLGLSDQEKSCQSQDDYKKLQQEIIRKIKELQLK